jgi:hypothetical protein
MLYYSIVFSLDDPKTNPYVWMFCLLIKSMMQTGTFTKKDTYYVLSDNKTIPCITDHLGEYIQYVEFLEIPKPTTLLEGMLWKYKLHTIIDIKNKDCMYLDVDMLSVLPFFPPIPEDTLCVLPEGNPENIDYCGCWKLDAPCGFSAAFFAFNFGPRVYAYFEEINHLASITNETFYTIEQPFFNKALENAPHVFFDDKLVSINAHENLDTCCFISYAGEPGNAYFHWQKGLAYFLTYCK